MPRPKDISAGISHAVFTSVVRIMNEHDLEEVRIGELHIRRRMRDPEHRPVILPPPEVKEQIDRQKELEAKAMEEEPVPLDTAIEQSTEYQLWKLGTLGLKP